jgi:hypothetical protein
MTNFNRTESAKWAQENQKIVGELHAGADKALADAAGRGFPLAPGATLATILAAGQVAKDKLTEGNAKIYEDRRKVLFEQDEFAMKLIVSLAKLGMELYREELMNALAIEQTENTALRDLDRADVERMQAQVDARQVSIIRGRAEAERLVTIAKARLVEAERGSLASERALIDAQLATAVKKLEIIDSIYEVLAAEELVLAAENRRAATLALLLEAQQMVAEVKRSMIPFYVEKAAARHQLAGAITAEIPITEAIVELGYDRIALEAAKEVGAHGEREAQEEYERARMAWTRANATTEFYRTSSRKTLQSYANTIQDGIIELRKELATQGAELRLDTHIGRVEIQVGDDVEIANNEKVNVIGEIKEIVANLNSRALNEAAKVDASATQQSASYMTRLLSRKIVEGAF